MPNTLPLFLSLLALLPLHLAAQEALPLPGLADRPAISGYWFPAADTAPAPAVIGLHGCSGALDSKGKLAARWKELARWFNREGMHFLMVDSFTPRGLKSICEIANKHRTIDEHARRDDAFAAIRWLAARPDVDAARIVVAGWSHGGQTVLQVLDRSDRFVAAQPVQPRAAVAYYPGCSLANRTPGYALSAPLLLMIGELDDWTPASTCEQLAQRLRGKPADASASIEMIVYPESYHGFDGTAALRVRQGVANTRSGTATVGGNREAREQSRVRMFDYLAEKLDRPLRVGHETRFR